MNEKFIFLKVDKIVKEEKTYYFASFADIKNPTRICREFIYYELYKILTDIPRLTEVEIVLRPYISKNGILKTVIENVIYD